MTNSLEIIDDIKCYAPDLAKKNNDYPSEVFQFLYEAEGKNFWFISRNTIIKHLFKKYIGERNSSVLEVGCGTGYVLKGLAERFPNYVLQGSDIHLEGIKFAKKRHPQVDFVQLDATNMPFKQIFDAIGAFDVLEHIEEDEKVMQEIHKALKPNQYFIISVPQYQWMWSITDDMAYHKRRYSRKELKTKLRNRGFEIVYVTSFVFTLFPLMYISRLFKGKNTKNIDQNKPVKQELDELKLSPLLNTVLTGLMKIDEMLIKMGISLPFGGSLVAIAKKI